MTLCTCSATDKLLVKLTARILIVVTLVISDRCCCCFSFSWTKIWCIK